jgi:hypothetical protein
LQKQYAVGGCIRQLKVLETTSKQQSRDTKKIQNICEIRGEPKNCAYVTMSNAQNEKGNNNDTVGQLSEVQFRLKNSTNQSRRTQQV